MAGLIELFTGYPEWAVDAALSVKSGIPAKFDFLPPISKVLEFLEAEMRTWRYAQEWEEGAKRQLLPPPDPGPKPTLAELKAKHGENWGLHPENARKKKQFLSIGELAAEYAVPRETIDAMPDGKSPR
jgi:hypothetical protein